MTSEERREVAEKLRHASHTDANFDVTIAIAILETIGEVNRPIAAVVADLIDPTCELSVRVVKPEEFENYTCSSCGANWINYDTEPDGSVGYGWAVWRDGAPVDVRYCPYCGARVIR